MLANRSGARPPSACPGLVVLLVGLAATACALPEGEQIGGESQPIIGGQTDLSDPAVVYARGPNHLCTGTLVADTVVLTAAHCLPLVGVDFGTQVGDFTASRRVIQNYGARNWQGIEQWLNGGDIALARLESAAPVEVVPVPINTEPLDDSFAGTPLRLVGFGVTDGEAQTGGGTKRDVDLDLEAVTPEYIRYGNESANQCQGDSGGPVLMGFDGTERIIAVVAHGEYPCLSVSTGTRADVYDEAFLREVIDAWSGPCKQDGNCVTEGCRTPDPDCDICGFDGICAEGCEKKDLDCPVSGFQGDPCEDREDCETLLCLEAPEDPRVKYCSAECDPDNLGEYWSCWPPLSACAPDDDGKHYCRHAGITPGVQGYECTEHDECRSGICYPPDNGICAEPCSDDPATCAEPYSCENVGEGASLCVLPEGGGCCQASAWRSDRSAAGTMLLAGLVLLLLARPLRGHGRGSSRAGSRR